MGQLVALAIAIGGLVILFRVAMWYDRRRDVTHEYHAGQLSPKPPVDRGGDSESVSAPVYRWVPHAVSETRDVLHSETSSDDDNSDKRPKAEVEP
jgi:HAMP domain-containing protein